MSTLGRVLAHSRVTLDSSSTLRGFFTIMEILGPVILFQQTLQVSAPKCCIVNFSLLQDTTNHGVTIGCNKNKLC